MRQGLLRLQHEWAFTLHSEQWNATRIEKWYADVRRAMVRQESVSVVPRRSILAVLARRLGL